MDLLSLQSALGLLALIALAWLVSENRRAFPWRTVAIGLAIQIALAALFLGLPFLRDGLFALSAVVGAIKGASDAGAAFVFGHVGGGPQPFEVTNPQAGISLAFQILPIVIVVSALAALFWHWRVLPLVVRAVAFLIARAMGIGGAAGTGTAASLFLGMTEAPMLVRPYLEKMSRGELFVLFTAGLATVAGTVLVLYATILEPAVPGALGHILVASVMSLPAAIVVARIMIPDVQATAPEAADLKLYKSSMDAVARGTQDGLTLYLQIIAMLIVVIALVNLGNQALGWLPPVDGSAVTVERVLGWVFTPVVVLFGVPLEEAGTAGALMGAKVVLNEFVAYLQLAALPDDALSERTRLIMLYAMCGFANLGSVGMMIAAISAMAPSRRDDVVALSLRALVSGNIATGMTGAVIGLMPVH